MTSTTRITVRNTSALLLQRGIEAIIGLLIAFIIPRLMKPEVWGQYVLLTSLSIWFVLVSTLGFRQIIGRYMGFLQNQSLADLRVFLGNLISIRFLVSLAVTFVFVAVTALLMRDFSIDVLIITGLSIFLRALSQLVYDLFLGLGETHRWAIGDLIRRGLSVLCVALGYTFAGLRGAMLGWVLCELIVLATGIIWTRPYLSWPGTYLRFGQMTPYLKFGFIYFISTILLSAFQQSGGVIVRVITGDYVQVGYFGSAYNIYLAAALVIPNLTLAFTPLLSRQYLAADYPALRRWIENLFKWLCIGCMVLVASTLFLAKDVVPIILGPDYQQVALYLVPLTIALFGVTLDEIARLMTMVLECPRYALYATIIQLVVFLVAAVPLIFWLGGIGGCIAVFIANMASGVYLTAYMQPKLRYTLRTGVICVLLGIVLAPLSLLPASFALRAGLFLVYLGGYSGLLFLTRLVRRYEVRSIWHAISNTRSNDA